MIIGCDFHPSWQQIAWVDSETGETGEQKLVHASGEARKFYAQLRAPALIGIEATGNSQWFVEMVEDVGHAIWIGDAAAIRASYGRRQKTDKRDAAHILRLRSMIYATNQFVFRTTGARETMTCPHCNNETGIGTAALFDHVFMSRKKCERCGKEFLIVDGVP